MKKFEIIAFVFYTSMIFFGAFLPIISMILVMTNFGLGYTQLNTTLAALPGFFVGAFLILFSLNKLGRILL